MVLDKVIFCRIGWGKFYGLDGKSEILIGGGQFNKLNTGSEVFNFRKDGENLFGYVQPVHKSILDFETINQFNFKRILNDNSYSSKELEGVTVIFYAVNPYRSKSRIIGWYKNAKLIQKLNEKSNKKIWKDNTTTWFNMKAKIKDCILLPVEDRKFIIPKKGKGKKFGTGRSNVYYTTFSNGGKKTEPWIDEAINYVENYKGRNLLNEDLNKTQTTLNHVPIINKEKFSFSGEYSEIEAFANHKFLTQNKEDINQNKYNPIVFYNNEVSNSLKLEQKNNSSLKEIFLKILNTTELKEIKLMSYVMSNSFFDELKIFNTCQEKGISLKILVAPPEGISHNFALKLKSLAEKNKSYEIRQIKKNIYSPNQCIVSYRFFKLIEFLFLYLVHLI